MKKSIAAALVSASILLPTAAFAQGQTVPAGDSLAQTPPIDVKGKQIRASGGISGRKLRTLHRYGSTAHRVRPRY